MMLSTMVTLLVLSFDSSTFYLNGWALMPVEHLQISNPLVPLLLQLLLSGFIAMVFADAFYLCVLTMLLSYCADRELNDSTGLYCMTDKLREAVAVAKTALNSGERGAHKQDEDIDASPYDEEEGAGRASKGSAAEGLPPRDSDGSPLAPERAFGGGDGKTGGGEEGIELEPAQFTEQGRRNDVNKTLRAKCLV
jgi:hypothetical protein